MKREINAALTIAFRDFTKLLRDRPRIMMSLIFPIIFIGALGGTLQASLGPAARFDVITFIFTGMFVQTLFQSTAMGIISLIEDRENDFSQEIFVSPISRYTIIFGKILGESLVSYVQILGIILFSYFMGASITIPQLITILIAGIIPCLFGGAFGTIIMANLGNQRGAQQMFPFIMFPQIFLSGVFTPIKELPTALLVISRLMPMTYPVDFIRGIFYMGHPDYDKVVIFHPLINLLIISILFVICLTVGTFLFVRNERNR